MRLAVMIAVVILFAGCEPTPSVSTGTPTWNLVEDQRIGSVDDDAKGFTRIEQVLVTRDRRILVSDNWTALRVVDSTGRFLRPIGGEGSGPGEYQRLDGFGLIADTIWIFDEQRHRITLYGRDGEPLTTVPFRAPEIAGWRAPGYPGTLMGDGTIIVSYGRTLPPDCMPEARMLVRLERPREGVVRGPPGAAGPCTYPRRDPDAPLRVRDTVGTYSLRNSHVETVLQNYPGRSEPLHVVFTQPLGDHPLWRPAHDGMTMVFIERPAASSADTATFSVTKLVFGDTTIARRYQYAPVPAPDALIDSVLANTSQGRYGMPREAVYHPRFRPPVSDALVGNDGSVWLKREFSYGVTNRWTVIHPSGEIAADVNVPSSHQVRAADAEFVWTTFTDDSEVPFIVRHRIVKSGPPR